jgi:hypothetical protein
MVLLNNKGDQQPIFQQDSATCLQCPANSPDLNPIENLCSWLDMRIAKHEPRKTEQLIAIVTNELTPTTCQLKSAIIYLSQCVIVLNA